MGKQPSSPAADAALKRACTRVGRIMACKHHNATNDAEVIQDENGRDIVLLKWECPGCDLRVFERWPCPEKA